MAKQSPAYFDWTAGAQGAGPTYFDWSGQGAPAAGGGGGFVEVGGEESNPWGPDIIHRLLDQTEEAAHGMLTAPWYIGKSVFADVKNVFDGKPGGFATDDLIADIAKTTWRDIKRRWTPLVEGNLGEFWNQVEHDPLGFLLDGATLATGGAAAAAKAGKAAAEAGNIGRLSKTAGLRKTDTRVDDFAKDIAAGRGMDVEALPEADLKAFRSYAVENIKREGGVVDKNGFVWEGPKGNLKGGNDSLQIALSNNPVIRARQEASIKFSNKFENVKGIGSAGRLARAKTREDRRLTDREYHLRTADAERALSSLDGTKLSALSVLPWREAGMSREAVSSFWKSKLDNANIERQAAWQRVEKNPDAEKAARAADLRHQQLKERLAAIEDDAVWNAADPENMPDDLRAAAEALVETSKATTYELWEKAGGKTRNGQRIDFDDFWALQRSREARRMKRGDGPDELDLIDGDEINAADLAEQWKGLRYSYVRPHIKPAEFERYGRTSTKVAADGPVAQPTGRMRRNNFTTFDDAMDVFDPRVALEGARQVAQYNSTIRRVQALKDAGGTFVSEADVPDGWRILHRDGKLHKDLENVKTWLEEDAVVLFGREKALDDTSRVVTELQSLTDDGIFAAPAPVANELLAEFRKANEFVAKYDNATNVWRKATLTLRPVWITGNLIGQMGLLIATHGFIKGGAAYMQAVRMGTKGSLLGKVAPDVESAGLVRDALQEMGRHQGKSLVSVAARRAMGQKGAAARHGISEAWGSLDKITQFNAWLTDDIPRRAAFLAEIKPHVKRIQKETGMSFEQAALSWLDDPKVVDSLAAKVTGDLVDFRSLTQFERSYMRRLMPFWSWVRGATGRTWRLAMDEPWKVWAGVNAAQWGIEENEEQFGDLPDFLKGMLPAGEGEDGQQRIVASQSINPFGTFGDVAGILKSASVGDVQIGGSNPASMANPFLKSLVETFTNRDLFYGTPLDYGAGGEGNGPLPPGYLGKLSERLVSSFPQQRLFEKLTQTGDQGNATLYENSDLDTLLAYFLLPTKQLNVSEANERAKAQREGAEYTVI